MALRKFFYEYLSSQQVAITLAKVKNNDADVLAIDFPYAIDMNAFETKMSAFKLNFIQISNPKKNTLYIAAKIIDGHVVAIFPNEEATHAFLAWCTSDDMLLAKLSATEIKFSSLALTRDDVSIKCTLNYAARVTAVTQPTKQAEVSQPSALSFTNHAQSTTIISFNGFVPPEIIQLIIQNSEYPLFTLSVILQVSKDYYKSVMRAFVVLLGDSDTKQNFEKWMSDPEKLPKLSQQKTYTKIFSRTRSRSDLNELNDRDVAKNLRDIGDACMKLFNYQRACIVQSSKDNQFSGIDSVDALTENDANMGVIFFPGHEHITYFSIESVWQHYHHADRFLLSLALLHIPPYAVADQSYDEYVQWLFADYFLQKGVAHYIYTNVPHGRPYGNYLIRADKFLCTPATIFIPPIENDITEITLEDIAQRVSLSFGGIYGKEVDTLALVEMHNGQLQLRFKADIFPRELADALRKSIFKDASQDALVFKSVDLHAKVLTDNMQQRTQYVVKTASITISGKDAVSTFLMFYNFPQNLIDAFIQKHAIQNVEAAATTDSLAPLVSSVGQ